MPNPPERDSTARQSIAAALNDFEMNLRELSTRVRLSEKELVPHLEHLQKSLPASGRKLVVTPAQCKKCEYEFDDRSRLSKPSRCPKCKGERIEPPRFVIEDQ